jgi:hypothetical protein
MQKMKPATLLLALVLLAVASTSAMAFTAPASSTALGYDFYDFANRMTTGAPGFAIGIGGIVMAGFFLFQQKVMPACGTVFGVICVLKATSIVGSLGSLV